MVCTVLSGAVSVNVMPYHPALVLGETTVPAVSPISGGISAVQVTTVIG